ncbi:MAG: VOC family protein [Streptosporangiaceae bacterium]|jgi:catechol 2,3-dioxygenase-like lactoylglutathione lyase family enzyme
MTSNDVTGSPSMGTDMNLEVVTLPVADVDRAKRFYQGLGWRLDNDRSTGDDFRLVQFTPPHSQCSIHFGRGLTVSAPGAADRLILSVKDIDAAREDLISRGVEVSDVYHYDRQPGKAGELESRVPGPDPEKGRSYFTYASFSDPDGNGWLLQEITTRLPGRTWEDADIASRADLLHETAEHHGRFEAVTPPHNWWDWYAAYMIARETGSTPDEASAAADRYMAEVKHVVVAPA